MLVPRPRSQRSISLVISDHMLAATSGIDNVQPGPITNGTRECRCTQKESNNSDLKFWISWDGGHYYDLLLTISRTRFLANPNQIGLGVETQVAGVTCFMTCDYFCQVTSEQ